MFVFHIEFIATRVQDLDTDCEILWVKIDIPSCKSLYIATYRHNATDADSLESMAESLRTLPQNAHIWVMW